MSDEDYKDRETVKNDNTNVKKKDNKANSNKKNITHPGSDIKGCKGSKEVG